MAKKETNITIEKGLLVDPKNLKIKHTSGICFQLHNAPEPEDIIFLFLKRKRKNMEASEIASAFSSEIAAENTEASLNFLVEHNYLNKEENKYQLVS